MVRRMLLAGIFLVALLILIYALTMQRDEDEAPPLPDEAGKRPEKGFKLDKYDDENNHVAIITGKELRGSEKGPNDMIEPTITVIKDKNTSTVISADWGRIDSRAKKRMGNSRLKGNVVMTITDKKSGDETVLRCEEIEYLGAEEKVIIPGDVKIHSETMEMTGTRLTTDRTMGMATLQENVRLVMKKAAEGVLSSLTGEDEAKPKPGEEKVEPIVITCDGKALFHRNIYRATFEKNVLAVQGENSLAGDHLVVEFEKKPEAVAAGKPVTPETLTVRRIIMISARAEGVVARGPGRSGAGDRFDYNGKTGLLVFSGAPCRMTQTGEKETRRLFGSELRFGRKRLLTSAEPLPRGMTETSQKLMVTGDPARVESVAKSSGRKSVLTGGRLLIDQDVMVVWLTGDAKRNAVAQQEKRRLEAKHITFRQKTKSQNEAYHAKGPGRLEIARTAETDEKPEQPIVVVFGDQMTYRPADQRANCTGGVEMTDGGETIRSRTLSIEVVEGKKKGSPEIKRLVASGDVLVKGTRRAAGEKLVYERPTPGEEQFEVTLTAKPGTSCAIRTDELFWRAERIHLVERPAPDGGTTVRASGDGKGTLQYTPARKTEAEREADTFEARYEKAGSFDEEKQQAVFEQNVRLTRKDMNLEGQHVVMDFVKEEVKRPGPKKRGERLDVATITATDKVKMTIARGEKPMVATAQKLVWHRKEGTAELHGDPSSKTFAKVTTGDSEIEAPLMMVFMKDDRIERVDTSGGGKMTGYTRSRKDPSGKTRDPFHVTWQGEMNYRVFHPDDPKALSRSVATVKKDTKAVGENADATADELTVHFASDPTDEKGRLKLEVQKAVATGNARAKMFLPEKKYYRYAKGDLLEWDRLTDTIVVMSQAGDAVVWDESKEWIGERLVLSRTKEKKLEAESTSSRRIVIYEEGIPSVRTDDAKAWKPIY